jgi:hypothetical protein
MKLSTITWIAFFIICFYYLNCLGQAYYQAVYAWQDARNSKAYEIMIGK